MKIATIISRSLLGLVFVVFGSNEFLHFFPMPKMSGEAGSFLDVMYVTHYLYVMAAFEVIGGFLLLAGRYGPLGLTLVGPVVVNILTFHTFMAPSGLPVALVVSVLALFLLWSYREHFAGLVKPAPRRRSVSSKSLEVPLTPEAAFSAAVAQQTVRRSETTPLARRSS